MPEFQFSSEQKRKLRKIRAKRHGGGKEPVEHRLSEGQIEQLEIALTIAAHFDRQAPALQLVRDEYDRLKRDVGSMLKSLERLTNATLDSNSAAMEVRVWMREAEYRSTRTIDVMDRAATALRDLQTVVAAAEADTPKAQRGPWASPIPVKIVHDCLDERWGIENRSMSSIDRSVGILPVPSSDPNSAFFLIVKVCYEAMRARSSDGRVVSPDRAIRAHLKQLRERDARERIEIGIKRN